MIVLRQIHPGVKDLSLTADWTPVSQSTSSCFSHELQRPHSTDWYKMSNFTRFDEKTRTYLIILLFFLIANYHSFWGLFDILVFFWLNLFVIILISIILKYYIVRKWKNVKSTVNISFLMLKLKYFYSQCKLNLRAIKRIIFFIIL